ncbi:MAG: hypothetical protein U0872_16730 [Planctomycetaceae bacterium]
MNKLRVLACLRHRDDHRYAVAAHPPGRRSTGGHLQGPGFGGSTSRFRRPRAKSKIPDVSGIWLYNGEKLVAVPPCRAGG